MANWSWNMLMFLMVTSCNSVSGDDDLADPDCFDPELAWDVTRCSLSTPQFCRNVKGFLAVGGTNRNHVRAGGNERFGRRDFLWHSGGEAVLTLRTGATCSASRWTSPRTSRNPTGASSSRGSGTDLLRQQQLLETTSRDSRRLNLTVSVDRPTFINFLNPNRTFFFNTQWFFQYLHGLRHGLHGPTVRFNVLFTFAIFTGYFQDRLNCRRS